MLSNFIKSNKIIQIMQPKKLKYNKIHKKKFQKFKYKTFLLKFGVYGLKSLESGFVSSYQFKTLKYVILKNFKKQGKIWYNTFPNFPVTAKPIEVRMGKGKGNLKHWSFFVPSGFLILEVFSIINISKVLSHLKKGQLKLPMKTKIVFQ